MKAVIYFVFKDTEDNYIEDIQKQLTHDVNQFIITDVTNPNKSIYNKIENIFYFKDMSSCLNNLTSVLNYLEIFNYKEIMLLNLNKSYDATQLVYKDILTVKEEFAVINKIL